MQAFMNGDMGVRLTMEPNYENFSCQVHILAFLFLFPSFLWRTLCNCVLVQFNFGVDPLPADQDPALKTPCLAICPTAASRNSIRNVVSTDSQCPQVLFLQQTCRLKSLTKIIFVLRKHLIKFTLWLQVEANM